ncbi:hypothetical protein Q0M94_21220 (plasmid) [Deinococcus radiomollis]
MVLDHNPYEVTVEVPSGPGTALRRVFGGPLSVAGTELEANQLNAGS